VATVASLTFKKDYQSYGISVATRR